MRNFIKQWKDVNELIEVLLSQHIQVYVVGGFVRSYIENVSPRDIDIIVDCDMAILDSLVISRGYSYSKNLFGNYKLNLSLETDMWTLANQYHGIDRNIKLRDVLFYNYDSIIYDVNNDTIDSYYYDKCMRDHMLDFVGTQEIMNRNLSRAVNFNTLKAYSVSYKKGLSLSKSIIAYLKDKNIPISVLQKEYERHYHRKMDQNLLNYISDFINNINDIKNRNH